MDPQLEKKRLFIGGLFDGIKKEDLVEKFSKFGQVDTVDIKVKENNGCNSTIAFVEMLISPQNLAKCFRVYSNTRWKGCDLKLEVAKESFLSRLQKERELASSKSKTENKVRKTETSPSSEVFGAKGGKRDSLEPAGDEFSVVFRKNDREAQAPSRVKQKRKLPEFAGTSSLIHDKIPHNVDSDEARLNNGESRTQESSKRAIFGAAEIERNGVCAVRQTSEEKPGANSLLTRLEKFSGTWNDFEIVGSETRKRAIPAFAAPAVDKKALSEKKRMESIQSKLSESNAKQKLIKDALKNQNVNKKANNKIIFDEEYESKSAADDLAVDFHPKMKHRGTSEERNMALFDSESEEESAEDTQEMFRVKPQYEGEAGQELIALQSRFGNDERFKIDERFVEDDPEAKSNEVPEDETQRQLDVLERVLGYELPRRKKDQAANAWSKIKQMRYDPTQQSAAQLEIQNEETGQEASEEEEEVTSEEENLPEVSKERYYQVSETLKDVFSKDKKSGSGQFSLLQALGINAPTESKVGERSSEFTSNKSSQKPRASWDNNPFKYDSSSDDDDDDEATPASKTELYNAGVERKEPSRPAAKRQTFFVFEGDSRLKDGVEFFTKPENMDGVYQNWKKTRFQVIQEFRSNQKNVLRKKASRMTAAGRKRLGKPKPQPKRGRGKRQRQ